MADTPTPEQLPEGKAETQASLKALGIGDFKGLKTVKNEDTGTIYGVIAEVKGLSLSLSPRIDARFGVPFVGIFVRVRAQKMEDWANLDEAGSVFGITELAQRSAEHASVEFFVVAAAHPSTPYEVRQIIESNKLFENILTAITARVEAAGTKLLAEKSVILDYMLGQVADSLPSEPTKQPKEFPVLIGGEAIAKYMHKLAEEYGYIGKKKGKKKPDSEAEPE